MKSRHPRLPLRFVLRISVLVVLTALAVAISMQGWRARDAEPFKTDLVTQIMGADDLINKGRLPAIGAVSSFFARIPPGTTWLLVPGLLVFNDPRLFDVPTSTFFFLLTLVGIVILGRLLFDETLGWIAACLYAFSSIGLFFASSLWPRGHPFFVVWTLYFCYLATKRSRPIWLVFAAVLYLFGVYVFLELVPLGIIFIAVFKKNRKLLTWWVLPTIALIGASIWTPYLRFQSSVHFVDVIRLLTTNTVAPGAPHWCGEALQIKSVATGQPVNLQTWDTGIPPKSQNVSFLQNLYSYRFPATVRSLLSIAKLENSWRNPLEVIWSGGLFSLMMLGVGVSFLGNIRTSLTHSKVQWMQSSCVAVVCGLAIILLTLILLRTIDPGVNWDRKDSLYVLSLILCFGLLGIIIRLVDGERLSLLMNYAWSAHSETLTKLLLLSLLAGQLAWSVAAPFDVRRLAWLWPVECLYIAFGLRTCCRYVSSQRVQVLLLFPVIIGLAVPIIRHPLRDWLQNNWSGDEEPVVTLLDHLAEHRKASPSMPQRKSVSVSYDIPAGPFILAASSVDSRYRLGMAYDLYLKYKHSLQQELVCADSYSSVSDYIIREDWTEGEWRHRWRVELHPPPKTSGDYVLLAREGRFSLFQHR